MNFCDYLGYAFFSHFYLEFQIKLFTNFELETNYTAHNLLKTKTKQKTLYSPTYVKNNHITSMKKDFS